MKTGDNPWRAIFLGGDNEALTTTVSELCLSGLGQVAAAARSRAELTDFRAIDGNVKSVVAGPLSEYGVQMKQLNISSITRTFGEMIRQAGANQTAAQLGAMAAVTTVHHGQIPFQPTIVS